MHGSTGSPRWATGALNEHGEFLPENSGCDLAPPRVKLHRYAALAQRPRERVPGTRAGQESHHAYPIRRKLFDLLGYHRGPRTSFVIAEVLQ